MVINATIAPSAFGTIAEVMARFTDTVQGLVGGVIGLWLILIFLRWYEYKRLRNVMVEIKDQLVRLNSHFGAKEIEKKQHIGHKIIKKIKEQKKKRKKKKHERS